nr:ribonuclease H-like domain, reverse transcriptase, RNA-dependent DNA polymerase [Tanacetum cinerariifolium]
FDLDYLTNSMNYELVSVENHDNKSTGPKEAYNSAEQDFLEELKKLKRQEKEANDVAESLRKEATHDIQNASTSSTNLINTTSTQLSIAGPLRAFNDGELSYPDPSKYALLDDPLMPHLEDIYASPSEGIFTNLSYDDEGVVTNFNNLETTMSVSLTPTTRIHTIHPKTQILRDPKSVVQTRSKVNKNSKAHALILVDLPFGKKTIRTKWVYMNKKDEKGVVVRNKARLVSRGCRAWYATLSTFFEKSRYRRGAIDKTLFINKDKKDIMLVQVYVDDIIFGSTKKSWFQMSYMGELTIFLGLQTASTPIETLKPLVKDEEAVDVDITPKTSYLHVVKRIFSKELASPKQITLGKDISNPLMAG